MNYIDYLYKKDLLQEDYDILISKNIYNKERMKELELKSIYQDLFPINTDNTIATINYFRLGKLPNENVFFIKKKIYEL